MTPVSSNEKHLLQQVAVLVGGYLLGMAAAYFIVQFPLDFSASVEEARRLGIVSATTLKGYPKAKDTFTYAVVLLAPPALSFLCWLVWERWQKTQALATPTLEEAVPKTLQWRVCLTGVALCYAFIIFNVSYLYKINENTYVGPWLFLGEEGSTLSAVQSILSGGVFSKDFSCNYGPLLIYPLAWFMKIFGATVMMQRVYAELLNVAAYSIIIAFLYRTVNRKTLFVAAAAAFLYLFSPFLTAGPNASHLRVALGFLPLMLAYRNLQKKSTFAYLLAGITAGASILLSQEVGAASAVALLLLLFLGHLPQWSVANFLRSAALIAAGALVAMIPFLAYFASQGALVSFVTDMVTYPRLYILGFSAYPFPDFGNFLSDPMDREWFVQYWVIFLYGVTLAYLAPRLALRKFTRQNMVQASLAVFGILLYRSALCRPDVSHTLFTAPPAIVLFFLLLDDALKQVSRAEGAVQRYLRIGPAVALALYFAIFICSSTVTNRVWPQLEKYALEQEGKWSPDIEGVQPFGAGSRGNGIPFSARYAETLVKIDQFLARNTSKGEYVYFFPNEASYYFLFDRNNPTRYPFAYQAITYDARAEAVRDLERRKPRFVVYSRSTWRIDSIPEDVQVPEIVNYLKQHYVVQADYGDVAIMKRVGE